MEPLGIPPFSETEIEREVVVPCGGRRAHPDATRNSAESADFVIGNSVVELKFLDANTAITLPRVQEELAHLFSGISPGCPTAVIDRTLLDEIGRSKYDNAFGTTIKTNVKKAKSQLRNSVRETGASCSVLWIINNSCTVLDHAAVQRIASKFIKNDTGGKDRGIDVLVVSGHYMLSDGFNNEIMYPIDCMVMEEGIVFPEFAKLRDSWNNAVERRTTSIIRGLPEFDDLPEDAKKPIEDLSFELGGVTYVKPAPRMYSSTDFFGGRRPRKPFEGSQDLGPQCTIYAGISRGEWDDFRSHNPPSVSHAAYDDWVRAEAAARARKGELPLVVVPVSYPGWSGWLGSVDDTAGGNVHEYASRVFHNEAKDIWSRASEFKEDQVPPNRFLCLVTRQIGQDARFDVSSLHEISHFGTPDERVEDVWVDLRLDLDAGLAQAAAQGVMRGVGFLYWKVDATYGWA